MKRKGSRDSKLDEPSRPCFAVPMSDKAATGIIKRRCSLAYLVYLAMGLNVVRVQEV